MAKRERKARKKVAAEAVKGAEAEATAEVNPENDVPAVVVFGMNENSVPQAAWFSARDAAVAVKAAGLMGLKAARIEIDAHREIAAQLRQGQVYAHSRTFAPIVNQELYSQLFELCGGAPVEDLALPLATNFDEIEPGSLVLAIEDDPDDGWWEAVVVGVEGPLTQLRWRHDSREASIIRSRHQIALIGRPAEH
jgi:hypothetical protein